MPDSMPLFPADPVMTLPGGASPGASPPALSIVIPVYNGADSIGELVAALEELRIAGGHEIVLVNDGSPDNSLDVCRALVERARVPITLVDLARNYGEHNAVMAGLRHASGAHVITMDDDLQNPPEEVERLLALCAAERKRGRLHLLRRKAARGLAQSRQPVHQLGRRFRARQAEGFLSVELPLHERLCRARDHALRGPLSLCRRADPAGDAGYRPAAGAPSAARGRTQQLHAAPAAAAVDQHVRQFLGDAAAAQHPDRVRAERAGALGSAAAIVEALFSQTPPGWASLFAAVLLLSGVQLLILGIVGEYLGRLYLTANKRRNRWCARCCARPLPTPTLGPSLRCTRRREGLPVALSYLSLAGAVLFGIAGQIALKSGAVGAASIAAQLLHPADDHRVRDLRRRRALLHRRAEQIPGVDRIPVGRRELCDRRGHRASVVERAARLAAARRHSADRRRHPADPPALKRGEARRRRRAASPLQCVASYAAAGRPRSSSDREAAGEGGRVGQLLALDDARLIEQQPGEFRQLLRRAGLADRGGEALDQPVARVDFEDALGRGVELAVLLSAAARGACPCRPRRRRGTPRCRSAARSCARP